MVHLFDRKDYRFVKLSVYAHKLGIHYHTAWRWFKAGKIAGYQADTGTIIVTESLLTEAPAPVAEKVVIYTRVSAAENKSNLEAQAGRLQDYCAAKGWVVTQVVKEIGSGINDNRPKLLKLLTDPPVTLIVVEHKDRLTRFGFNYIEQLLTMQGRRIEVINQADASTVLSAGKGKEDLIQDFVSIVTSFCARLYGQRRCKRKTERIIAELRTDEENHSA
jgi:predicted site-specific integrase-resolvase